MAERCGRVGRGLRGPAEPDLRGAPPAAAGLGAVCGLAQQRVLAGQPAPQLPPRRQGDRQPQRHGRIMVQRPGQHLPRGGILGVQPAGRGRFPWAGLQPRGGLPGHPQRVPGQGRLGLLLLARLGELPGPVGAQRLQRHIPEPAIRPGLRRAQQRAVHQMQHRRSGVRPGDGLGGLQREGPREHRHHPEYPPLALLEQLVAPLHRGGQ